MLFATFGVTVLVTAVSVYAAMPLPHARNDDGNSLMDLNKTLYNVYQYPSCAKDCTQLTDPVAIFKYGCSDLPCACRKDGSYMDALKVCIKGGCGSDLHDTNVALQKMCPGVPEVKR